MRNMHGDSKKELLGVLAIEPKISSLALSLCLACLWDLRCFLACWQVLMEHYQILNTFAKIVNLAGCVNRGGNVGD